MNRRIARWLQVALFASLPFGTALAQIPASGANGVPPPEPTDTPSQKRANDTVDRVPMEHDTTTETTVQKKEKKLSHKKRTPPDSTDLPR